jgi:hypothetical protein
MTTAVADLALPRARASGAHVAPSVWLAVATVGALALALRLPVATTVLGLVAFGVLHNVLELRYVTGRFDAILAGPFLWMLGALITGVVVCRLLPVSAATRGVEIGLSYVLLAVACVRALSRWWLALALAVLAGALLTSLTFPAYHFVVLTHLHNVVPLFFLWEWSRGMAAGPRRGFRAVNLGWVVGVPALILAGVFDPLLRAVPATFGGLGGGLGGVAVFEPVRLAASYAPPALAADMGLRFLAVFAFMQTMHYVVWVGLLPRYAPEAATRFDARVPLLRGGRAWLLGGGLALALGVVFALDYAQGRTLYAAGASYHAYLEFPVLLALILAFRPRPTRPRRTGATA